MQEHTSQSLWLSGSIIVQAICSGVIVSLHSLLQPKLPSHSSVPSLIMLPQLALQSLSALASALGGQQPSPLLGSAISTCEQSVLHFCALPTSTSIVHTLSSLQ